MLHIGTGMKALKGAIWYTLPALCAPCKQQKTKVTYIYIAQMLKEFANRIGCSNMHSMAALGALTCKAWHHCMGALYARHDGSTGCSNMAALGALIYIYKYMMAALGSLTYSIVFALTC